MLYSLEYVGGFNWEFGLREFFLRFRLIVIESKKDSDIESGVE